MTNKVGIILLEGLQPFQTIYYLQEGMQNYILNKINGSIHFSFCAYRLKLVPSLLHLPKMNRMMAAREREVGWIICHSDSRFFIHPPSITFWKWGKMVTAKVKENECSSIGVIPQKINKGLQHYRWPTVQPFWRMIFGGLKTPKNYEEY